MSFDPFHSLKQRHVTTRYGIHGEHYNWLFAALHLSHDREVCSIKCKHVNTNSGLSSDINDYKQHRDGARKGAGACCSTRCYPSQKRVKQQN